MTREDRAAMEAAYAALENLNRSDLLTVRRAIEKLASRLSAPEGEGKGELKQMRERIEDLEAQVIGPYNVEAVRKAMRGDWGPDELLSVACSQLRIERDTLAARVRQLEGERGKVECDVSGKQHTIRPEETALARTVAEMCRDYIPESALEENEMRIALYRESIEARFTARVRRLEGIMDNAVEVIDDVTTQLDLMMCEEVEGHESLFKPLLPIFNHLEDIRKAMNVALSPETGGEEEVDRADT